MMAATNPGTQARYYLRCDQTGCARLVLCSHLRSALLGTGSENKNCVASPDTEHQMEFDWRLWGPETAHKRGYVQRISHSTPTRWREPSWNVVQGELLKNENAVHHPEPSRTKVPNHLNSWRLATRRPDYCILFWGVGVGCQQD